MDPVAYAVLTAADGDDARKRMGVLVDTPEFQTALRLYREGTFILFKPVPGWLVDDGVRSVEKQDDALGVFRSILNEVGIPYVELGEEIKDLRARVTFAMKLINQNGTSASLTRKCSRRNAHIPVSGRDETVTRMRLLRRKHGLVAVIVDGGTCRQRPQQIHGGRKSTNLRDIGISV